jgi:hypothetical protein
MRGIIFGLLTFIVGGLIGLGLEKLALIIGGQVGSALTRIYNVGIHPLSLNITVCGIVGLILGYLIIEKFVRK